MDSPHNAREMHRTSVNQALDLLCCGCSVGSLNNQEICCWCVLEEVALNKSLFLAGTVQVKGSEALKSLALAENEYGHSVNSGGYITIKIAFNEHTLQAVQFIIGMLWNNRRSMCHRNEHLAAAASRSVQISYSAAVLLVDETVRQQS